MYSRAGVSVVFYPKGDALPGYMSHTLKAITCQITLISYRTYGITECFNDAINILIECIMLKKDYSWIVKLHITRSYSRYTFQSHLKFDFGDKLTLTINVNDKCSLTFRFTVLYDLQKYSRFTARKYISDVIITPNFDLVLYITWSVWTCLKKFE